MLPQLLFSASEPTYHLLERARRRVRPLYESDQQKHERERQTADYLLLSLTNCGRTWLRVILGRALQLHYADVRGIDTVNLHDLFSFSERIPTVPAIKPMHEKYGQFGNSYERQKVVLLVRDPRDALVSRYHQHKAELGFESLDRFVQESSDLDAYIQFYNDWQKHQASAKAFLLVRYEEMRADTLQEVRRVAAFLNLALTDDELSEAIAYASFKNMRKMEVEGTEQIRTGVMMARDVNKPESFKVRKGSIGGYRAELSPASIAWVDDKVATDLDPIYGYSSNASAESMIESI